MKLGALSETVSVAAEAPVVDTATARIARRTRRGEAKLSEGAASGVMGFATGGLPEVPVDIPFERAIDSTAAAQDLGDLFEYKIKERISIRKNQSALVPIVNSEIATEKLIQRYTRQLNQHEDRLAAMHRERTDLEARQTKAQSELNAMLDALSLDVAVTATQQ